jgi:patatin-like phospholipase/acyl hydrolase
VAAVGTIALKMKEKSVLRRSDGILPELRKTHPWPEDRPFRILSIDGGGIRGILPAAILAELELRYLSGHSIGKYFDLITGTSTGGIIALGLGVGKTAKTIFDLYMKSGEDIFPPLRWNILKVRSAWNVLRAAQYHRYDATKLEALLRSEFQNDTLGHAERRVCVPSFDGFTEVNVFKTPHHEDYKMDWKEELVTIAMATAAAPTYFPVYKNDKRLFADGGVWANNPVMIGLVDALVCYQLNRRQVHILSIGTGDTEIKFTENQVMHGGLVDWYKIMASAMHLQSQNAIGQAGLLIGRDHLIRLNAKPMPENPIELDDFARASTELPPIALELVNEHGQTICDRFFFEPAESYIAHYGPRSAMSA